MGDTCMANPDCDYFDYAEAYEEIDIGMQTCDNAYKIDLGTDKNVELDVCFGACKHHDCKYFYWQSAQDRSGGIPLCHLYSSCAHLRTPSSTGRNFRKTEWTGIDLGTKTCSTGERISQGAWDHET